jgi:hypothetical protein
VTAGHLIARLHLALHRNEDLDHLHHARRQLITTLKLLDLILEAVLKTLLDFVVLLACMASISPMTLSFDSAICHHCGPLSSHREHHW